MPLVATRDYRASWEIPYDFHPRIRDYPGVKSVVRAYMDAPHSALSGTAHTPVAPRPRRGKRALQHYRIGSGLPEVAPAVDEGTVQPATTRTVSSSWTSAPIVQPERQAPLPQQALGEALTMSCPGEEAHVDTVAPKPPLSTSAQVNSGEREVSGQRHPRNHAITLPSGCRAPQRPVCAAVGVGRRSPSENSPCRPGQGCRAPLLDPFSDTGAPPPSSGATATHPGYRHRTKQCYSLPPSYAAERAQWQQQPVPSIRVADRYRSPPHMREYRLSARQIRNGSRANFVKALRNCISSGVREAIPRRVTDALTDTRDPHSFDPSTHNFNLMVTDAFHDSVEERAARLRTVENRMWERIVVNVAPLEVAHRQVMDAGGLSVLDSGHISSPIYISPARAAGYVSAADANGSVVDGDESMAVVVRPFTDELLGDSEALRLAEEQRRWPKGREWDRQVAIQRAVGATVQEAIIDLGIDPRYRHPGDRPGRPH